jgi:translocation and assembly module TamB
MQISAQLANLGVILPQFPGPVTLSGTAQTTASGTAVDVSLQGPAQVKASVIGKLSPDYRTADLKITGSSSAALANAMIAPRSLDGALRFDLALQGPFAFSALTGQVALAGGRLADPTLPFGLKAVDLTATLGGGSAQLNGQAAVTTGGRVGVTGSVGLVAPYPANLAFTLDNAVLRDPQLYATTAKGAIALKGPAFGGGMISGAVTLGKTELQIPSTGVSGAGDLPGLRHIHESAASQATRQRAGLGPTGAAARAGAGYGLDVTLSAPNQVFMRGRGLDAELGGTLVLRGTTAKITPSGAFNLLRGRLDILGRRLVLSEAQVQLQGALVPYVHIVAAIESGGIASSVVIDGEATNPAVTFTSLPDMPQEQVLAHLLFDRSLDKISAFQAAQLGVAVATLAGRGGDGVMGAIRRKTLLDNLDVQADGTGNATVTAGKYLGDKAYSEVTMGQSGKSSISLNYDLGRHITAKTHADSEGTTGLGLFVMRDY